MSDPSGASTLVNILILSAVFHFRSGVVRMLLVLLVSTLYLRCLLPGCTTELRGLWYNPRTVVAQASHLGGSLRDLSLWWQRRQLSPLPCWALLDGCGAATDVRYSAYRSPNAPGQTLRSRGV